MSCPWDGQAPAGTGPGGPARRPSPWAVGTWAESGDPGKHLFPFAWHLLDHIWNIVFIWGIPSTEGYQ